MANVAATPETRSVRLLKVGEQVRHVLSELLARQEVHDEVLTSHTLSVTEVRMSPDLRHAAIFIKPLLGANEEAVLKALRTNTAKRKWPDASNCGSPPSSSSCPTRASTKQAGSKVCWPIPRCSGIWAKVDIGCGKTHLTAMTMQTRLSAKGQVVIPKDVRDRLGLTEGTVFDVIETGTGVTLQLPDNHARLSVEEAQKRIREIFTYDGPPVSIEAMRAAAKAAVADKYRRFAKKKAR
jgi:AbrB family looped-hinge helix DNA binding protein